MSLLSRLAVIAARGYGLLSSNPNNLSASYLVVAGGGSGGYNPGGGGGAGGLLTSTFTLSTLNTYSITVGAGGAANGLTGSSQGFGNQGSNSVISGTGLTTVTSLGGGYGGAGPTTGSGGNGGSGGGAGGAGTVNAAGLGTSGQGNNGGTAAVLSGYWASGGGGGASAVGGNAISTGGVGGAGTASSISGSSVTYAGGGGGGGDTRGVAGGAGGAGGGGLGGGNGTTSVAGTANRGGGGGGGSFSSAISAAGGSGIVIISYTSATPRFVGGTLTTSGGNQIHTFTSSGTLSPITPVTASYLVVAGGGGGGRQYGGQGAAGGGGAGGLLTSSTTLYSGATYVVTVGAGGAGGSSAGAAPSGSNSELSGTGLTTITSVGGGGGAGSSGSGASGGSGGGGQGETAPKTGGSGTSGQGNAGGAGVNAGGGGGGASAAGTSAVLQVPGVGGAGTASSISGSSITYAGGGGGGAYGTNTGGAGGAGGGGQGQTGGSTTLATSGTANLGGGGGGAAFVATGNYNGAAGGSGVVIISYAGSQQFNGGLVTSSGGNTIHTFTSTGALTPLTNNLTNSLRFRRSASAYLNRTFSTPTNNKIWTYSAWVKRGALGTGTGQTLMGYGVSGTLDSISFNSSEQLSYFSVDGGGVTQRANYNTTAVFRDPSAWYHIVVAVDTTQATAGNRFKLYVNGNQQAVTTTTSLALNWNTYINSALSQGIGWQFDGTTNYFDGYMADINFIDGQALEPYYFGNNDANGVWKPILYKGTYGTNGFYLTFGNTTSTTTLGYDSSPNGNNWTTNNISLTAGTTYDAMTDVPTNTSATVANYATINPLLSTSNVVLSEANLKAQVGSTGGVYRTAGGTFAVSSGKWYWELVFGNPTTGNPLAGVGDITVASSSWNADTSTNANFWYVDGSNGNKINGTGGPGSSYGSSFTTSDTCMVALDMDNGKIWWGKNGTWFASGDPAAGTNAAYTNLASKLLTIALMGGCGSCGFSGNLYQLNFGQRPFSYTPPTGFVALNTFNLPTPTILQGNKYMDATLYTGNGTTNVIVNQAQFQPDFVWGKSRSLANSHILSNSVAGATKFLISNSTAAEGTNAQAYASFNSNGFTLGTDTSLNSSGATNVAWQWQAGQGSTSSNTSGSITSTVSVNTTAGFSVVTWTGAGSSATIGHGLGVAPNFIIIKRRNSAVNWYVGGSNIASAGNGTWSSVLEGLNTTSAVNTGATAVFNSTAPTSTVFTGGSELTANGGTYVAYCWAEIAGFSKFGSYTGNGSSDGPFVATNFKPKFILIKVSSTANGWVIYDTMRDTYNYMGSQLYPHLSNAESVSSTYAIDALSNGFKIRTTNAVVNDSGQTFIYAAFASHPFKNSNAA